MKHVYLYNLYEIYQAVDGSASITLVEPDLTYAQARYMISKLSVASSLLPNHSFIKLRSLRVR